MTLEYTMNEEMRQGLIRTLTWTLADIDFRNKEMMVKENGMEKEDSPEVKEARELLKQLKEID